MSPHSPTYGAFTSDFPTPNIDPSFSHHSFGGRPPEAALALPKNFSPLIARAILSSLRLRTWGLSFGPSSRLLLFLLAEFGVLADQVTIYDRRS